MVHTRRIGSDTSPSRTTNPRERLGRTRYRASARGGAQSLTSENAIQIALSLGKAGVDGQRPAEMLDRLCEPALLDEDAAPVVLGVGEAGVDLERPAKVLDGHLGAALPGEGLPQCC